MPAPTITPLPTPPSRGDSPETFNAEADAFLGALPTLQTEVNDVVSWVETTAAEVEADKTAAAASATAASAAVAATFIDAGVYVPATAALTAGGQFAEFSIGKSMNAARFYAKVLAGTGSVDITVLDDNYPVYGPVTVNLTATDSVISFTIARLSDVQMWLSNITGSPMGLIAKIEGAPA